MKKTSVIILICIIALGAIVFNELLYKQPLSLNEGLIRKESITVSGSVMSGGDTTPEGQMDAPRRFVYQIKKADNSIVNVSYVAYPPSPVGDELRAKIKLNFYTGTIRIGDYLKARGTYDRETNTVTVATDGEYIETYPQLTDE